jgi:chromosome segregation ATPase
MKLKMTMESMDQESAELDRLRSFIDSSSEELREMKAKKAVLKSSIKRWVETFQAAKGRLPTIEDQRSSLEENFFEMYQKLGSDVDSLKKRQDEAYLKIRDSSKNIDRMKELIQKIKDGTDT